MSTQVLVPPSGFSASHLHVGGATYSAATDGTYTVDSSVVPQLLQQGFALPQMPTLATLAVATGSVTYNSIAPFTVLTGTLSGDVTIVLPNAVGVRQFDVGALNLNTHNLLFSAGSGTTVALPVATLSTSHQIVTVVTEGANVIRVST